MHYTPEEEDRVRAEIDAAKAKRSSASAPSETACQPRSLALAPCSAFDRLMGADIARCTNEGCAVRESCLRWVLRRDDHARVFFHGPLVTHGCKLFINDGSYSPNEKDEQRRERRTKI